MSLPWSLALDVVRCAQRRVATDPVQPLLASWRLHWYGDPGATLHWRQRQVAMGAGVLAIIAPQTPFTRRVATPVDRHVFVHFRPDPVRDRITDRIWFLPCGAAQRALLDDLVRDLPGDGQPQVSAPWRGAALVATALEGVAASDWPRCAADPRVVAVMRHIDLDLSAAHGNARLAAAAGMRAGSCACSSARSACLRSAGPRSGASPPPAGCSMRPRCRSPRSPRRCGYCDRTYFTAAFTRAVGVGPGAYRRRATGPGE